MKREPLAGKKAAGLARHQLRKAEKNARSFKDGGTAESLHDLRTSLRRLRVVLSAYRDCLGPAAARSLREELRALSRMTSSARDAQVWSAWLQRHGAPCEITHRLIIHLDAVAAHCRQQFLAKGLPEFTAAARKLAGRLDRVKPGKLQFRKAACAAVCKAAKRLDRRMKPVRKGGSAGQMHLARIRIKRLRYLLEPFARSDPRARNMVGALREMQDLLGTLHDLHQLTECGVAPASEPARMEAGRLEQAFQRKWLKTGRLDRLLSAARRFKAR
jgi:CHAD domain-containing protein